MIALFRTRFLPLLLTSASSSIVNSPGLPRLKGPMCSPSIKAINPATCITLEHESESGAGNLRVQFAEGSCPNLFSLSILFGPHPKIMVRFAVDVCSFKDMSKVSTVNCEVPERSNWSHSITSIFSIFNVVRKERMVHWGHVPSAAGLKVIRTSGAFFLLERQPNSQLI